MGGFGCRHDNHRRWYSFSRHHQHLIDTMGLLSKGLRNFSYQSADFGRTFHHFAERFNGSGNQPGPIIDFFHGAFNQFFRIP